MKGERNEFPRKIRFEIVPQGTAALYLKSIGREPTREDVDTLVELFKLYYERGREDALKVEKESKEVQQL